MRNADPKATRVFVTILLAMAVIYAVRLSKPRNDSDLSLREPLLPIAARKPVGSLLATQIGTGAPWSLSDQHGKVVLLNYFATWCPPCRTETPDLVRVAQIYRSRGFEIVGVNREGTRLDDADAAVSGFVQRYQIPYPIVREAHPPPPNPLGEMGLPTSILVDRQGRVAFIYQGALSHEALAAKIEPLLREAH